MSTPKLLLFGAPSWQRDAGSLPLPAARPGQLLAYLACRGAWVSRETVSSLLWPDRDTSTARANLRALVLQTRRLAVGTGLEAGPDALRWSIDTDVHEFEAAAGSGRWSDAVDRYRGPLLEGFDLGAPAPWAEWLVFERSRLHSRWRDALTERFAQIEGDPTAVLALAAAALTADPLDEVAMGFRMRALAAVGRADDARRCYREFAQRLEAAFGIEPPAGLRDLAQLLDAPEPRRRRLDARRPAGAAGLVGRRLEMTQLSERISADDCRILTITGYGGVGKTALARAAMQALRGDFEECHWIALDDLSSVQQVPQRCIDILGGDGPANESPQRQLRERLGAARVLMVFDNAEHLQGFGAWAEGLVGDCAAIKLLVTSRRRLGLPGEWLLALEGLPVPDADEDEPDVLRAYDSVRLFESRAAAQHPEYDAQANAREAAALARAAEGLPLALELAASRVRLLPVAEIARELVASIDMLEPLDDGSERQRSLRASFERSWQLLAPREQRALAACSIFGASFSREAAEIVADAPLPVIASLVDKSLVRADGRGRFSLHLLIRQCAARLLDDATRVRRRHAEYFARLLARSAEFRLQDHRRAIAEVETELAHGRAAWLQAVEDRSTALMDQMTPAFRHFFEAAGRWTEGIDLLSAALAVLDAGDAAHRPTLVAVSNALAALHYRRADFAQAQHHGTQALAWARAMADHTGIKSALNTIGLSLWQLGQYADASAHYLEALAIAEADEDEAGVAQFKSNLAIIEKTLGRYAAAAQLYEEALAIERRTGNQRGLVTRLNNLGNVHRAMRDWGPALRCFEEGLAIAQACSLAAPAVYLLVNLALTTLDSGDLDRSERYGAQCLEQARLHGETVIEIMAHLTVARLAIARGQLARADASTLEALRMARQKNYTIGEIEALAVRASVLAARGQPVPAAVLWRLVASHPLASAAEKTESDEGIDRLGLSAQDAAAVAAECRVRTFESAVADAFAELSAA